MMIIIISIINCGKNNIHNNHDVNNSNYTFYCILSYMVEIKYGHNLKYQKG